MPIGLPAEERRFIRSFVKLGGVDEKTRDAERAARVKGGSGAKMLKLKRVQEAVKAQMEPIRLEQERQKLVGSAVVAATATLEAENAQLRSDLAAVKSIPAMRVVGNETKLEERLMQLVMGLDMERHSRVVLAALQTGFVVAGLMEQGKTRRVTPIDGVASLLTGGGTYSGIFAEMREEPDGPQEPVDCAVPTVAVKDEPTELYPVPPTVMPVAQPMVSVVPLEAKRAAEPRVVTVEIG